MSRISFRKKSQRIGIALKALSDYALKAVEGGEGALSEILPCVYVGQMHLDGGNADRLERIEYRNRGVSVRSGVYYDAVKSSVCRLYLIDDRSLVVGLEYLNAEAQVRSS